MIAAKILSHEGYFIIQGTDDQWIPAELKGGLLIKAPHQLSLATQSQLLEVYNERLKPLLVDDNGHVKTFKELHIDQNEYLNQYRKTGYYKESWKLIYAIMPNSKIIM